MISTLGIQSRVNGERATGSTPKMGENQHDLFKGYLAMCINNLGMFIPFKHLLT